CWVYWGLPTKNTTWADGAEVAVMVLAAQKNGCENNTLSHTQEKRRKGKVDSPPTSP
ncbi:hypothetical protein LCGC14_2858030, partial [marine sediment metagenome]